jgi:hypothetical protein
MPHETTKQKNERLAPHREVLVEVKTLRRLRGLRPLNAWECSCLVRESKNGDVSSVNYWKSLR